MIATRSLLLVVFAAVCGCRDVSHFSTGPGEAYCGSVVQGEFVRQGFSKSARLRMTFNADLVGQYDLPGQIATDDGLFNDVWMRPIPQLAHDPLSTLNFGDAREDNLIFAVDPSDPARGPTILAVLSLLRNGDAEVRLIRGAPPLRLATTSAADGSPIFGVFSPLHKQPAATCGF
jgi:hypothetical protein